MVEPQQPNRPASPGPQRGARHRSRKYAYLALAGLAFILNKFADLNERTRRFVEKLDADAYQAARNLNPLGLANNYYRFLSDGEQLEEEARRGEAESQAVIRRAREAASQANPARA